MNVPKTYHLSLSINEQKFAVSTVSGRAQCDKHSALHSLLNKN